MTTLSESTVAVARNQASSLSGTIESIFSTPIASGPMVSLSSATLIAGVGLNGDRYATQSGTYSCFKASLYNDTNNNESGESNKTNDQPKQEPGRQLTLISGDGVRQVLQELSEKNMKEKRTESTQSEEEDDEFTLSLKTKSIGDFRRNIVLTGVSASELLSTVGCVLEFSRPAGLASPRLLVHRNCVPCMYNERKNKIPGLMEALWDAGGVSCEVLVGGTIHVGDRLTVVEEEDNNKKKRLIDPGRQSSGFFVRPSKRTAAMVREAIEGSKKAYAELIQSDPEGVERAETSYASVGLKFWPRSVSKDT